VRPGDGHAPVVASRSGSMDTLWQDVRFGLRMLFKAPVVSVLAIVTCALGIGVNMAIFSVVDAVALRRIGVDDAERIVRVINEDPTHVDRGNLSSWIELHRFGTASNAFAGIAGSDRRAVIVKDRDQAHRLLTNVVSDNYFDVFQLTPAAGRVFTAGAIAQSHTPAIVLGYDYWQRQYSGNPEIVGQTIVASEVPCVVLGVLPRSFRGTELFVNPDVYLPVSTWLVIAPGDRVRLERPQARQLELFGRLRPDVTPAQAAAALTIVQQQLAAEYPQQEAGRRLTVKFEREARGRQVRTIGALLIGVAALVLLIACANIANLLLVRGDVRRLEMTTRVALGASRWRVIRQLATETALLAAIGAGVAVLLAGWVISLLPTLMPPMEFPIGFDFRLDARVLGFGAAAAVLCVFIAGVLPAIASSDVTMYAALKDVMGGFAVARGRWRDVIVIAQVAITVVLLISSGLLVRTLIAVGSLDPGFDAHANMLIASLDVRKLTLAQEHAYDRELLQRVGALPGVEGVALGSRIPMWGSGGGAASLAWISGLPPADRDGVRIGFAVVSPNYFSTLGTRIIRGRPLTEQDTEASQLAVVVNQSAARALWATDDAVGRRFRLNGSSGREVEVVGIAQDGRYLELTERQRAYMFLPMFQEAQVFGSRWGADVVVVRTAATAASQATAIRRALAAINPDVLVLSTTTMNEHIRYAMYGDRLTVQLVGSMGLLGLMLAAIGLFGVISQSVARRTREIGLRIALGANPRQVMRLVLARASLLAGCGIAAGVALAVAGGRALSSLLYGVSVRDPLTFVGSTATMAVVALLAAAIPARRAVRVDPIRALKTE
jgi:putative ABC transport system permease protein